jgi:hypothetical protein
MTLAKGHHAQTRGTATNYLIFHTVAVRLNNNGTLLFVTGEDDTARFDSLQYTYKYFMYYMFPTRLHVHQRMNANGTSTKWFIFLKQ